MEPGKNAVDKKIIMRILIQTAVTFLFLAGMVSCNTDGETAAASNDAKENKTDTAKTGWVTLFDGKTQQGWHGFNKPGPVKNWAIEEGALVCLGAAKDAAGGD